MISATEESLVLSNKEVRVEPRAVFRLDLPNRKTVGVKSKPGKTLGEVLRPVLHKYGYRVHNVAVSLVSDSSRWTWASTCCGVTAFCFKLSLLLCIIGIIYHLLSFWIMYLQANEGEWLDLSTQVQSVSNQRVIVSIKKTDEPPPTSKFFVNFTMFLCASKITLGPCILAHINRMSTSRQVALFKRQLEFYNLTESLVDWKMPWLNC